MDPWQFDPAHPAMVKMGTTSLTKLSWGSSRADAILTGTTVSVPWQLTFKVDLPSACAVTTASFATVNNAGSAALNLHSEVTSRPSRLTASTCVALRPVSSIDGGYTTSCAPHTGNESANNPRSLIFINGNLSSAGSWRRIHNDGMSLANHFAGCDRL